MARHIALEYGWLHGEIEKVTKDMYKDGAGDDRQGNNEQKKNWDY
jgi:hypothetical protein